ncbi:MAG: hypothetical protein HRU11_03770 [Parvularculaceae bacterium]|nr:hypothetical protein [Parvularculaceae bacterium]
MKTHILLSVAALALLAACDQSSTPSDPPSVEAGVAISANEATVVTLNATVIDPKGDATLTWSQVSGPPGSFSATNIEDPDFMVPPVPRNETIVLRLTATSSSTSPVWDDVTISVADTGRRGASPQDIEGGDRDNRRARGRPDRMQVENREVRSFDGSNNNVANPDWGRAFAHLKRLGTADYEDGVSSLAGANRPSARLVSNLVSAQADGESLPNAFGGTDFVWQWGQFLDHDLDLTDGAEESADIPVPSGDAFFDPSGDGGQVIFFSRALFDPETGTGTDNPREQENEISSWIDGSMIYGSDDERALALRVSADSPFLATSEGNLLPFNVDSLPNANGFIPDPTELFLAGDVRVNEQVGLAVMHTLWVREHNRLAQILVDDNPTVSGEVLFQAARRLVIAKLQHITYEEFLPVLIGPNALPPYAGYDDSVDGTIFNEFSVAAYRLGHSMLNEQMLRLDAQGAEVADGHLGLRDAFFAAHNVLTTEDSLDPILRGLAGQNHQAVDAKVVSDVRNFLFGLPGQGGFDLVSLNIQRGRDHGVPSYNDVREAVGLVRATSFADVTTDTELQAALAEAYGSVDDIDLWVGGLAEDPLSVEGSQLGELFREIMILQWSALRDGDRFWYERDLTPQELDRVRSTSLARVIRDNTGVGDEIQDNVFIRN